MATVTTLDFDIAHTEIPCKTCGDMYDPEDIDMSTYDHSTDKGIEALCWGCSEDREVECPECHGEGRAEYEVRGGRWNSYLGGWEPDEVERECNRCHGEGRV